MKNQWVLQNVILLPRLDLQKILALRDMTDSAIDWKVIVAPIGAPIRKMLDEKWFDLLDLYPFLPTFHFRGRKNEYSAQRGWRPLANRNQPKP